MVSIVFVCFDFFLFEYPHITGLSPQKFCNALQTLDEESSQLVKKRIAHGISEEEYVILPVFPSLSFTVSYRNLAFVRVLFDIKTHMECISCLISQVMVFGETQNNKRKKNPSFISCSCSCFFLAFYTPYPHIIASVIRNRTHRKHRKRAK